MIEEICIDMYVWNLFLMQKSKQFYYNTSEFISKTKVK